MDHADYPRDTVPGVVNKIFRSQKWQGQRQRQYCFLYPKEEREELDNWELLTLIVADGDMGLGGLTHTMKITRAFVEAGVAIFHLDDFAIGAKKFITGEGRTVIPTSEHLSRLTAARTQIDVMNAETILLCRCDTNHSSYITSIVDSRDNTWVLGATKPVDPLTTIFNRALANGEDITAARKAWINSAELKTFDDAVASVASTSSIEELKSYQTAVAEATTSTSCPFLSERRALAKKHLPEPLFSQLFFDCDLPRTPEQAKNFPWDSAKEIRCGMACSAHLGIARAETRYGRVQGPELGVTYTDLHIRGYGVRDVDVEDSGYARVKFSGAYLADALLETATMNIYGAERCLRMGEGVVKGPK
ncbi:isocitrate lyase, putative [Talaromyces stipitatus ATCC 10500]|uniref:methylisocitrate lyase n=1 Tax=Talaromyces stipitatus (strain ATCC 10500 / CBS 375.48 / QM 6759 / NRRL 1006) TaxID=441959 RepID=B8MHC7_TALSN|nr:isocitrate lyase, putative [Talaromyces stipitatus ATCC 10500]EED17106.1 isocitrate lyase, putative [Talaromyces stipitatus ATCC 10500]